MTEYPKINTLYKRDQNTKRIIEGEYSCPEYAYLADNTWVFTEKADGTNIRIIWVGERVHYGGRTDQASIPAFLLDRLRDLFEPPAAARQSVFEHTNAVLYGEGYGAKIQKNGASYKPDGVDFVLFDVRIGDMWLERENVEAVGAALGLAVVPIIGKGSLAALHSVVALGFESRWGSFPAEGIVARPETELSDRRGQRIITKLKHKDFVGRGQ